MTFDGEEMKHGFPSVYFGISLGMPVPILMQFGEDKEFVKERVLKALRGEEIWCQLFPNPRADRTLRGCAPRPRPTAMAGSSTGRRCGRAGRNIAIMASSSRAPIPNVPKHKGLTYFWVDMKAPGVTVRPIKLAGGDSHVNEVFFDDVKIGDDHRMSPVGGGFAVAMATLMIERYVATDSAGFGPHLNLFVELAKATEINGKPRSRTAASASRSHATMRCEAALRR